MTVFTRFSGVRSPGAGVLSDATINEIYAQSLGLNTIYPNGVPGNFSWRAGGELQAWPTLTGWTHVIPWFQIYHADAVSYDSDVAMRISLDSYWLNALTGVWSLLTSAPIPSAALYYEDFRDNSSIAKTVFGHSSTALISQPTTGRALHGYHTSRIAIPANLGGLITVAKVKIISLSGLDLTASKANKYVGAVGQDFWNDPTAGSNAGVMVGRHTPLTTSLRNLYACTMLPGLLKSSFRPPVGIEQLTQIDAQTLDPDLA